MLSPTAAMFWMAIIVAAWPEATASAAAPPSIAAMRFSSPSVVGFITRV
jgi:hypothetical protein